MVESSTWSSVCLRRWLEADAAYEEAFELAKEDRRRVSTLHALS